MNAKDLLDVGRHALADLLAAGHPLDPDAIAGWQYRGVSLGLPGWVDRVAWKTFVKAFHRDPGAPFVRGWNVRLRQTGVDGAVEPLTKRGAPVAFGHFRVVDPHGYCVPRRADRGLLLDYGLGGAAPLDPTRLLRDPIVALEARRSDLLLGWSYLELGDWRIPTPSFFTLERWTPVVDPVPVPRGG
jgi:hypothetical protein